MRSSDWSSDVCSSYLTIGLLDPAPRRPRWTRAASLPKAYVAKSKKLRQLSDTSFYPLQRLRSERIPRRRFLLRSSRRRFLATVTVSGSKLRPMLGESKCPDQSFTSVRSEEHTSELQSLMRNS